MSETADHSLAARNRRAFPIPDTERSDIASAATIGLSRMPNSGQSTPAATERQIALWGECGAEVLPNIAHGQSTKVPRTDNTRGVALHRCTLGTLDNDFGFGSHRDPTIRFGQRRCVVCAGFHIDQALQKSSETTSRAALLKLFAAVATGVSN